MKNIFIALSLATIGTFAHAASDCSVDISKKLQADSNVSVQIRPEAKLCMTFEEPINAIEFRNRDSNELLRWQENNVS